MASERTNYIERTPWPAWVNAIYWGLTALICFAMLAGWDTSLPAWARLGITGLIAGGAAGLSTLLGGLTVRIQETRIVLHLGSVPLIHRQVPFDAIQSTASVQYRPLVEFGGWGIRGAGKRKAWTARGDKAVALELAGDRQLLIGSDHPHRLEDRIRSAVGRRLSRSGLQRDLPDDAAG